MGKDLIGFKSEMDNLFNRFFDVDFPLLQEFRKEGQWAPRIDISEGEKDITVQAEIPGCDVKDIEVALSANRIQGKMKTDDGKETMFRTVRVDPSTSEMLEKYNVTFKGEIESNFMATLLSWIVPTAIFFGVWILLMRRMAGQQPGFMSLGKNKAKIYVQDDLNVTFYLQFSIPDRCQADGL